MKLGAVVTALAAAALLLLGCGQWAPAETSLDGTLLFGTFDEDGNHQLFSLDLATGRRDQVTNTNNANGAVAGRFSPDGISIIAAEYRADIGRVVLAQYRDGERQPTVVSDLSADETLTAWSPDCRSVFFARFDDLPGSGAIWQVQADGSDRVLHFSSSEGFATGPDVSPHDGRLIFHSSHDPASVGTSLYTINLESGAPVRLTPIEINARWARWSPTADEVVFQEITADGLQTRVSHISGDGTGLRPLTEFAADQRLPVWSPDGEWLTYRDATESLVAMRVDGSTTIDLGVSGFAYDWGPHARTCPLAAGVSARP